MSIDPFLWTALDQANPPGLDSKWRALAEAAVASRMALRTGLSDEGRERLEVGHGVLCARPGAPRTGPPSTS